MRRWDEDARAAPSAGSEKARRSQERVVGSEVVPGGQGRLARAGHGSFGAAGLAGRAAGRAEGAALGSRGCGGGADRRVDGSRGQSWVTEADTSGSGSGLSEAVWETLGRTTLEPNCPAPWPETGKTVGTGLGHGTALVPGV